MNYTLEINLKSYLKDYFSNRYGKIGIASKENILGILIEPFLEKTPKSYVPDRDKNYTLSLVWTRQSAGTKDPRIYNYLSQTHERLYCRALEKYFWEIFFNYMNSHLSVNENAVIKELIEDFLIENNIGSVNDPYDMFLKKYYRYRKNNSDICPI